MRTSRWTATALCLTLALSACGGDDETVSVITEAPAEDPAEVPATDTAAITIEGFAFVGVTEVAVGTTVVVTNTDSAQHTWTAVDGSFDSGALGAGDAFEFTFTEPGEYEYFCSFHPSMTGTIVVTG